MGFAPSAPLWAMESTSSLGQSQETACIASVGISKRRMASSRCRNSSSASSLEFSQRSKRLMHPRGVPVGCHLPL